MKKSFKMKKVSVLAVGRWPLAALRYVSSGWLVDDDASSSGRLG